MIAGMRQAALFLHSLNKKDQKWLLKQLPANKKAQLLLLLDELKSVGIPGGQNWLPSVNEDSPQDLSKEFSPESISCIAIIDSASIEQVKKTLLGEPDVIIATVLAVRRWSWKEQFLNLFAAKRKKQLVGLHEHKKPNGSKKLTEAILMSVAERIKNQSSYSDAQLNPVL